MATIDLSWLRLRDGALTVGRRCGALRPSVRIVDLGLADPVCAASRREHRDSGRQIRKREVARIYARSLHCGRHPQVMGEGPLRALHLARNCRPWTQRPQPIATSAAWARGEGDRHSHYSEAALLRNGSSPASRLPTHAQSSGPKMASSRRPRKIVKVPSSRRW